MSLQPKCIHCVQALSAPARYAIYQSLVADGGSMTVGQLVKLTKLRQPTVSFHVHALTESGLVDRKKVGRTVFINANPHCADCPFKK
jgi:DNA-binding transcriptional ArsR family regulator